MPPKAPAAPPAPIHKPKIKTEYLVAGGLAAGAAFIVVSRRGSKGSGKTTTLVGAGGAGTLDTTGTDLMALQDTLSRQISQGFGRLIENPSDPAVVDPGTANNPVFTTPEQSVGITAITPASPSVISSPSTTAAVNPPPVYTPPGKPGDASPGATSWTLPNRTTDQHFIDQMVAAENNPQTAGSPYNPATGQGKDPVSDANFLAHLDDSTPWGTWTPTGYV